MSQSSENTTNEIQTSISKPNFHYLISCKCGKFHKFNIEYKNGFKVIFFCKDTKNSIEMNNIYNDKDYSIKCKKCKNSINVKQDYFKVKDEKLIFKCEKCISESESKGYININKFKGENEDTELNILNKFNKIKIVKELTQKTQFYENNLKEINELEKFLQYLIFTLKYYPSKSKQRKIIKNFFYYLDYMLEIALKHTYLFDIYHFKKECNIYGDDYEENKFLSENFNIFYLQLLIRCSKHKFLSLEMLKYVHNHLYEANLALRLDNYFLISNYFNDKKENVKNTIYNITSKISKSYLNLELFMESINFENRICNLENKITELTGNLKLEKYYNSFLAVPGECSFMRKNVNFILDKIIKNNSDKINFEEPNIKMLKKSFQIISNLKKGLDDILITNENNSLKLSIKKKLVNLEKILTKYQNSFDRKKNNEKINKFEPPLIELTEKEKNFLKENIINVKFKSLKKIKSSEKDSELQLIIDFLFNLKESDNDIIHINDENKIKYYSISNKFKKVVEPDKDDNINKALENIKETITSFSKMDEITYGDLINFTFNTPTNKYMISDSKVNYLLSFLKIKKQKLGEINEQYVKFESEMKAKSRKIIKMVEIIDSEDNPEKYKNFIEKYEIKNDYNKIKEYLNILIN